MAPEPALKTPWVSRVVTGFFFALVGVVLGVFTLFDVAFHYLARKRRAGLGAKPWFGALWSLALAPTRRAFWAVGFWIALVVLALLIFKLLAGGDAISHAAVVP